MDHPQIELITHDMLIDDDDILPTFSSSAIETFIHKIPNLSKQFLYLNDDIFLGNTLHPDDLYTQTNGVSIFTSWYVPDCASDCPWAYIGNNFNSTDFSQIGINNNFIINLIFIIQGDGSCDQHCNIDECQFDGGDCDEYPQTGSPVNFVPFHELIKQNVSDVKSIVDQFNTQHQKLQQRFRPKNSASGELMRTEKVNSGDIFAQSLIHSNKIYNNAFGFKSRHVIAHVGFFLDIDIINAMHKKFKEEFRRTQRHRLRNPDDMQFAFSYYHFLMSEKYNLTANEIFSEFDTDQSGTWSDREIRTILSRIYPLPLDWAAVQYFEDIITNCSRFLKGREDNNEYPPTILYERYEDSIIVSI